ncbi:hypothetical protein B0A50_08401 [Salinomyces thailandicus]|uniref:Uncharacterized protein n=1 Tax=Salinomyces thailandicus TaxID=706561 RepID=A0A4U0TLY6_9PEZI|nr:hypothetical protein B0A50_08401 [Salinomyces thailandica]
MTECHLEVLHLMMITELFEGHFKGLSLSQKTSLFNQLFEEELGRQVSEEMLIRANADQKLRRRRAYGVNPAEGMTVRDGQAATHATPPIFESRLIMGGFVQEVFFDTSVLRRTIPRDDDTISGSRGSGRRVEKAATGAKKTFQQDKQAATDPQNTLKPGKKTTSASQTDPKLKSVRLRRLRKYTDAIKHGKRVAPIEVLQREFKDIIEGALWDSIRKQVAFDETPTIIDAGGDNDSRVQGRIEMVHLCNLSLQPGRDLRLCAISDKFINHESPVYKLGGAVHRVVMPDGGSEDAMVCNTEYCAFCGSGNKNGEVFAKTINGPIPKKDTVFAGRPFVHSWHCSIRNLDNLPLDEIKRNGKPKIPFHVYFDKNYRHFDIKLPARMFAAPCIFRRSDGRSLRMRSLRKVAGATVWKTY